MLKCTQTLKERMLASSATQCTVIINLLHRFDHVSHKKNNLFLARLKPIIEGGTYRVWSKTQDLQLSAEQSYDPNMDPDSQSLLHYHWECQSTSKVRTGDKSCFSIVLFSLLWS